jgi:hypothetical protein
MVKCVRWFVLCASGGCLALLGPTGVDAQKGKEPPPAEKSPEERNAEILNDLMTAYRLADLGRSQKAPEALITAAGMLRRLAEVNLGTITEKPVIEDENGKKVADQSEGDAKPGSLKEEANELFDEAAAMGLDLNLKLDGLIKLAKERPLPPGYRGLVGGPKRIHRKIGPHRTETFRVHFWSGKPVLIAFHASHPMHIHVVRTDINHVWLDATSTHAVHPRNAGLPGQRADHRDPVTISIHNPHKHAGTFELHMN